MKNTLYLLFLITLLQGCLFPTERGKGTIDLRSQRDGGPNDLSDNSSPSTFSSITLNNDQITIDGSDLSGITEVKLEGSGLNDVLSIVSQTATQIVLSYASNLVLPLGSLVDIVITDAGAASSTTVTFQLPNDSVGTVQIVDDAVTTAKITDGAITAAKLNDMGAANGDVLVYNTGSTSWVPTPLSGLNYIGSWNANTNAPSLSDGGATTSPSAGDYYVTSVTGATSIDGESTWIAGDWIIYNGSDWQRINNAGTVLSFNGRTGAIVSATNDYTWAQINMGTSSIDDIADIDTSTVSPNDGEVLKWNNATGKWEPAADETAGAGSVGSSEIADGSIASADLSSDSVTSAKIADGSIVNADINASAAIDYSKLSIADNDLSIAKTNGLQTNLDDLSSDIASNAAAITTKEPAITAAATTTYYRGDKTFVTLNTAVVPESGSLYFSEARVLGTQLAGYSTGSSLALANGDSLIVALGKLEAQITSVDSSADDALQKDGSNSMTGDLDLGTNDITNAAAGTFSGTVSASNFIGSGAGLTGLVADPSNDSVTSSKIADGSILTADLSDDAITSAKIADVSVSKITSGAGAYLTYMPNNVECSDGEVLAWSVSNRWECASAGAAGTVTSITGGAGLTDGPFTTTGTININVDNTTIEVSSDTLIIKDNAITTAKVLDDAITTAKILDGEILSADLTNDSITSAKIVNDTITNADINTSAAIEYSKLNIADSDLTIAKTSGLQTLLDDLSSDVASLDSSNDGLYSLDGSKALSGTMQLNDNWISNDGGAEGIRIDDSGNVGIGTANPAAKLEVAGGASGSNTDILILKNNGGTAGNSGASIQFYNLDNTPTQVEQARIGTLLTSGGAGVSASDLTFSTTSSGTLDERVRITSSGNVGIGTTAPSRLLQVGNTNGVLQVGNTFSSQLSGSSTGKSVIGTNLYVDSAGLLKNAGTHGSYGYTGLSQSWGTIKFIAEAGATSADATVSPSPKMVIENTGYVGIGRTSPQSKLDVAGTIRSEQICDEAGTNCRDISQGWTDSSADSLEDDDLDTRIYVEKNTDEDKIRFNTAGSERMIIDENGAVGIGTATPATKLDVGGKSHFSDRMSIGLSTTALTSASERLSVHGFAALRHDSDTTPPIYLSNESTTASTIQPYLLMKNSAGNRSGFGVQADDASGHYYGQGGLNFYTGIANFTNNRMSIDSTGNVGIGTASPSYKLDVSGDASIGGDLFIVDSTAGGLLQLRDGASGTNNKRLELTSLEGFGAFINSTRSAGAVEPLRFGIDGAEQMRVHSTGNIGIGTIAPSQKLHIYDSGIGRVKIEGGTSGSPSRRSILELAGDASNRARGILTTGGGTEEWFYGQPYNADGFTIGTHATQPEYLTNSKLYIKKNGNVGIGTLSPSAILHLLNASPQVKLQDSDNTTADTALRGIISFRDSAGTEHGWIGDGSEGTNDISIYSGFGNTSLSTTGGKLVLDSSGDVGIGTETPGHKLHVIGTAGLSTGTAWTNTSDRRLKDIRGDYEYGLKEILALNTVRFNYKKGNELDLPSDKETVGFIAQEVQKHIPEAVYEREDGFLELNVDPIHWAGINAIQEIYTEVRENKEMFKAMQGHWIRQKAVNKEQERKIASLEEENEKLKNKVQKLEEDIAKIKRTLGL